MSEEKKLLYFVVASGKYINYVPLFLYSLREAYPGYDALVLCKGSFPNQRLWYKTFVGLCCNTRDNYIAIENYYPTYGNHPQVIKSLRWTTFLPWFLNYDYIYVTDIDLMPVREDPPLHERHEQYMQTQGMPLSNTTSIDKPAGNRLTGIQCMRSKDYFREMRDVIHKYHLALRFEAEDVTWNALKKRHDNQHLLMRMVKEAFGRLPEKPIFEYNGIHFGDARVEGRWKYFMKTSNTHRKYMKWFIQNVANKDGWKGLLKESPEFIRSQYETIMEAFYE